MIYLRNKLPYQLHWCGGKPSRCIFIIFWAALAALVFFNKTSALLHNALIGTTVFLLPDRIALQESKNNLFAAMQISQMVAENEKLREALMIAGKYRIIPARVKLGGGYLFLDSLLIDEGLNAGIKEGDAVVTENNILIGVISSAGNNWSKVKKTGSLGEKVVLVAADGLAAGVIFEAAGVGGGELIAEFPTVRNSPVIKAGDIVRWGGNQDFIAGLVDKVDFDENNFVGKITIISAAPPFAAAVRIVSENK